MSGEKFARSLMTPIPPAAILSFLQAGYPVDVVLRLAVHTINGIHSRYGYGARAREADPEFFPLVEKLRNIQQSGQIGLRVKKTGTQTTTAIVFSKKLNPAIAADRDEVRKLLGLDPQTDEFDVVYGSVAANDKEIALLTRSVLEIITDLSSYIDVPAAKVEQKRTFPSPAPEISERCSRAGTYADSQLIAKTRRCLCRRAVWSRLVLDRRQRFRFEAAVFFYHVSLHAHRHRGEARRTGHHGPRRVKVYGLI